MEQWVNSRPIDTQIICISKQGISWCKSPAGGNQSWVSAKYDHKLIRLREADDELAHQIRAKPDQCFVCKCTETTQPIRGQKAVEIHWSVTKI